MDAVISKATMNRRQDLIGRQFGNLAVIAFAGSRQVTWGKQRYWKCQCVCGNIHEVSSAALLSGNTSSCGCGQRKRGRENAKFIDLTGQRFERLTVIQLPSQQNKRNLMWECQCDCGNKSKVSTGNLKSGHIKSCGCLQKDITSARSKKHGQSTSSEYRIWQLIRNRCFNKNTPKYPSYGGRGIKVCERWRNFEHFFSDMGCRPGEFYSIDRKNNNGNYSCGKCRECLENGWVSNCRWATPEEQIRNTRRNVFLEFEGKRLCVTDWARYYNVSVASLRSRIKRGQTLKDAILSLKNKQDKKLGAT